MGLGPRRPGPLEFLCTSTGMELVIRLPRAVGVGRGGCFRVWACLGTSTVALWPRTHVPPTQGTVHGQNTFGQTVVLYRSYMSGLFHTPAQGVANADAVPTNLNRAATLRVSSKVYWTCLLFHARAMGLNFTSKQTQFSGGRVNSLHPCCN